MGVCVWILFGDHWKRASKREEEDEKKKMRGPHQKVNQIMGFRRKSDP